MIACKDCRHIDGTRCMHPRSLHRMTDYVTGTVQDVQVTCSYARTLGPCDADAKLFEPKDEAGSVGFV